MLRGRPNRDTCVMSYLERQTTMTGNQRRIILAAMLGDMLEFFDYFLIGFVLAFIVGPWKLTYGQSAIILLSSGIGAIMGAWVWGLARGSDRPAQGVYCHRDQFLGRHWIISADARTRLDLPHRVSISRRFRCRRPLLR